MKSKVHFFIKPHVQISIILIVLLFIFSVNNTAFSQKINSGNLLQQMSSNLTSSSNKTLKTNDTQSALIVKLLSNNLENRLQKAAAILNITSKLPQVRNLSYAHLLNQTLTTLHGIPKEADLEKRQIAQNILSNYRDFQIIIFIMPNGDIYFDEPYSRQQISTTSNLAFRDYFQGAVRTNDIYLGDPSTSASSGQRQSVIAVPVYSLKDNSTLVGIWAGGMDFGVLNKELQSLNLTSLDNNTRVVYVGHNGQKIADSDINKSKTPESFAILNSFKNAINRQSGSTIDKVNNTKMLVTYQPVNVFHNTWVVLFMQPNNTTIN
jgi:cache domain-containing protein